MDVSKERIEQIWKYLNEYGIYTMEEFEKAFKENPIYIGVFTLPINKDVKGEEEC